MGDRDGAQQRSWGDDIVDNDGLIVNDDVHCLLEDFVKVAGLQLDFLSAAGADNR